MTTTAIEQTVLHLPKQDRAHLAYLLLESLDEPSDTEIHQLWLHEAQRRADEIDQGQVELISGEAFEVQVQALFK
jgi:putative addiction module component (TIGR02574 family)